MNFAPENLRNGLFFFLLLSIDALHIATAQLQSGIELSTEEKAWLADHPVIRLAFDPAFAPVEFADDNGVYRGMAADYLDIIASALGIRFEVVPTATWEDALKLARAGEVDILPAVARTEQREAYLVFTQPYLKLPAVVITARKDVDDWSLEALVEMKVVVVSDYAWDDWITKTYPQTPLIRTPDIVTGLETVSFGAADVMIGDLATSSYFIGQSGISNLRVAHQIDQSFDLAIGVRADLSILRDILDQALEAIDEEQKASIKGGWIRLDAPQWWKNPIVRWWAGGLGGLFLATILIVSIWNRTLKHQVEVRTRQLHETQSRLLQAAKMESIGRLAAGVAHEVKNPLAILQMGLEFLRPDVPAEQTYREVMDDMQDAIDRANTVILGLLDFSRDKKLALKSIDLNEVLRRSLRLVAHELNKNNIQLHENLAAKLPAMNGDSDKLQQVFINLFINAIQAMDGKGALTVTSFSERIGESKRSAHIRAADFNPGDALIIAKVADTGPGIPEDKLNEIFDPFYTTKPVGEGTGLGLSITHNIVEMHRGFIEFVNQSEGGACAVLVFKALGEKA